MGVFIRNKAKRTQKNDDKKPLLVNTNQNTSVIGEEIAIVEKMPIRKGLGDKKIASSEVKKAAIEDVVVKTEEKKEVQIFENTQKREAKPTLIVNSTPRETSIFDNIITPKTSDVFEDAKTRRSNLPRDTQTTDEKYYDFVFGKGVLTNDYINIINKKLSEGLLYHNLDLSFMDLFFFRSFIKGKSIALIANSSDLLNRNHGDLIDSHDIVIRFNSYKLSKPHTGTKTTMHASVYLQNENLDQYVPIRFILSNHSTNWSKKLKTIDKFKQGSILKYNHHVIIPQNFKEPHPSTTGFSTLILLLKLGGYEKINMFGFNFYEGGDSSIYRTDGGMQLPISKVHNYNFEKNFVMEYSYEFNKKDNIITFYDYSTF
jgi:hypothetical protein